MPDALILAVVIATGAILFAPRLARAPLWRATITPLASIIGSGFLVLGPVLDGNYGAWAPLAMAALCLLAWAFGAALRYNIAAVDTGGRGRTETVLETVASWALAFAYIVSVAYYLNLFGAFAVALTPAHDAVHARLVTTALFAAILLLGWQSGFAALERLETLSVGLKLSIIAGLLAGLAWHLGARLPTEGLTFPPVNVGPWQGLTLGFGLIVTVQGFETVRYLGAEYDAATRLRAMRLAQGLSTAIYLVYVVLLTYGLAPGAMAHDETAIIGLMSIVAPILPALLVAAALSAQLSAGVADTGGAGGLVAELTGGRMTPRASYAVLCAAGLALTWAFDVFTIIAHASRAFALYYALQAAIAAAAARRSGDPRRAAGFAGLALIGAAAACLGIPAE